jgi:hypothetical protein
MTQAEPTAPRALLGFSALLGTLPGDGAELVTMLIDAKLQAKCAAVASPS